MTTSVRCPVPTARARSAVLAVASLVLALTGCSQSYPTLQEHRIALRPGELEASGVAFLTPSTVTGQEQEKQAVAFVFADVIKRERRKLRVVTLAETLGAVNRAGLVNEYKKMYDDYRDTGLLPQKVLLEVGKATGSRYLIQLKLQGFGQGAKDRFGLLGLRIVETQYAHVRLFFQIWDSNDGTVVWEAMQEIRMSHDTTSEEPIMQRTVLERTAKDLIARLP